MKLKQARSNAYRHLPELTSVDYQLLWHSGFWDGPTSGMLLYRGAKFWFEMLEQNPEPALGVWYRRFAVLQLSAQDMLKEEEVHEAFCRYVGTHCDYPDRESKSVIHPESEHHFFYDKYANHMQEVTFEESEVVAWFEQ
jgi:hypothetical protein